MLKFFRKKSPFVTIRAEEIQVADQFVYDNSPVRVVAVMPEDDKMLIEYMTTVNGISYGRMHKVLIPNELLLTVVR